MARRPSRGPTEAELEILAVLWDRGASTVREVNEVLDEHRPTGYTTTLKLMQLMVDKGLVVRDESSRSHVYRAKSSREKTQKTLVKDLLSRAFDGSAAQLVLRALAEEPASAAELAEIRQVLNAIEETQCEGEEEALTTKDTKDTENDRH